MCAYKARLGIYLYAFLIFASYSFSLAQNIKGQNLEILNNDSPKLSMSFFPLLVNNRSPLFPYFLVTPPLAV